MLHGKNKRTHQENLLVMMVDGGNGSNVIMMVDFVGHIDSLVKVAPITALLSAGKMRW